MTYLMMPLQAASLSAAPMNKILPAAYVRAHLKAYSAPKFYQSSDDIGAIMEAVPAFIDIPRIVTIPSGRPIFSNSAMSVGAFGVAGFPDAQTGADCTQRAIEQITG